MANVNSELAENLSNDVKECLDYLNKNNQVKTHGNASIYGISNKLFDRSLIKLLAAEYLNSYYNTN